MNVVKASNHNKTSEGNRGISHLPLYHKVYLRDHEKET
jgi:hypothetical protein